MAITAHPQTSTTTVPQVRSPERDRQRGRSRRALLGWGAVGVACLAVGALTVATLTGGDDAPPVPAHPGIIENGSPRAIDGSVEDVATVSAGPGLAEHGSPRAIDGSVEDRFTAPSAEATGSNVADMPPVATRGVPASPQAGTGAAEVTAEEEAPPATPSPLVSRKDPPL
jgi:hypothetical protein